MSLEVEAIEDMREEDDTKGKEGEEMEMEASEEVATKEGNKDSEEVVVEELGHKPEEKTEGSLVEVKQEKMEEDEEEKSKDVVAVNNSKRAGSPDKKVILLNPLLSNMFKSPTKSQSSTTTGNSQSLEEIKSEPFKVTGGNLELFFKKTETGGGGGAGAGLNKSDIFKASQALAAALKSEPKKKVFCANTNCNMKTDVVYEAMTHHKIYFGMKTASNPKICLACFKKAELYNQMSKLKLVNKENLFDLKSEIQTASSEVMIDLDSPPTSPLALTFGDLLEKEKKSVQDSEEDCYQFSEAKFNDILQQTLNKFDYKLQLSKCSESVTKEVEDLSSQFSNLDMELDKLRSTIEGATKLFNDNIAVRPKTVEVGTVDISETGAIKVKQNENVDDLQGISRIAERAFKKYVAELKSIEVVGTGPEIPPSRNVPQQPNTFLPGPPMNLNRRTMGKLIFVKPKEGQDVYAMHKHSLCYWLPAKILKVSQQDIQSTKPTIYTVQFQQKIKPRSKSSDDYDCYIKEVNGKQMAFKKHSQVTLPVGTRIIGKFKDLLNTDAEVDGCLYAGIIAEIPREVNQCRYLVFFDDGYAQYVAKNEVFPVCESSPDVWLDVHKNSQDFIREYITTYPNRHMIRAGVGTSFTVELNGEWLVARIVEIDSSLLKMQYMRRMDGVEFEWIYRGSTRLGPLYNRLKTLQARPTLTVARRHTYASRRTNFSFEVNRDNDEAETKVARKHTGFDGAAGNNKERVIRAKNGMVISTLHESEGNMIKIHVPLECPTSRPYISHTCSIKCGHVYKEEDFRKVSPLAIPFHLGWAREISGKDRSTVFYHTPCGVRLGTYNEIHTYITITGCEIPIDFFSLEVNIDCLNEFEPLRRIEYLKDISYGKEWTPVTCVNSLDHSIPLYMEYITARIPGKGVTINNNDDFLVCCDCEDDCRDKEKCACWKLTYSGISFKLAAKDGYELSGYENRRLKNHVLSGIYECNQKCKCRSTCFNRVVQNKVKWPIQMFKTVAKGWGVRALHDMPQGSFICVYTGQLLTDAGANESGIEVGDEYLAELDFIECNEQIKEDYESDCTDLENEEPGTKTNARLAAKQNGTVTEQKVAKKSTVQKAVKSTGGVKRRYDDGDSGTFSDTASVVSVPSSPSGRPTGPTARKSGSRNGASAKGDKSKTPETSSGVPSPSSSTTSSVGAATRSKRASSKDYDVLSDDDDEVQIYSSFSASASAKNTKNAPRLPLREYFGKDEAVYIMDAKSMGNFGRYLNHSCDPNVFVQNLFVDTHDPRFPWVAFFTKKDVKAGTELTWDYNYDIGSVPGKTLYCYCLTPDCRGRLL